MNCRLIIFLFFLTCSQVSAQTTGIGIGAILGEPTGISAKIWMSEHNAVTGALAWSFRDAGSLQIQADYLIHADLTSEIDQDIKGRAYFHYGIGGRLRDDTADIGSRPGLHWASPMPAESPHWTRLLRLCLCWISHPRRLST